MKQWCYPQHKQCVIEGCKKFFGSREMVIDHFREKHADRCALCLPCNMPYLIYSFHGSKAQNVQRVIIHYEIHHPNERSSVVAWAKDLVSFVPSNAFRLE